MSDIRPYQESDLKRTDAVGARAKRTAGVYWHRQANSARHHLEHWQHELAEARKMKPSRDHHQGQIDITVRMAKIKVAHWESSLAGRTASLNTATEAIKNAWDEPEKSD